MFGGWTSLSRKAVLPIFEQMNGLLYYPVQYEGEESSRNIFYLGAAPNQQAIPAVRYLMSKEGGDVRRWVLLGTDYFYPRKTNQILSAYLAVEGVCSGRNYDDLCIADQSDWREIVERVKAFAAGGKKTAVISTVIGDRTLICTDELINQQIDPKQDTFHGPLRQRTRVAQRGSRQARRSHGGAELLSIRQVGRKTTHSSRCGRISTSNGTRPQMMRWRRPSSAFGCGRRPSARPAQPTSMRFDKPCMASG